MEVQDIWLTIYQKSVKNSGRFFFCYFNKLLYDIIKHSPYDLVMYEWNNLNQIELGIYEKNKDLIIRKYWDQMDISAHNFIFLLASKHLKRAGNKVPSSLKKHIYIIVQLRNNLCHEKIMKIEMIRSNTDLTISLDATVVEDELNEMIKLYNDIFQELKVYLPSLGKPFPTKEEAHIRSMLEYNIKSLYTPNLLSENIKVFEESFNKHVTDLGMVTHVAKETNNDIQDSTAHLGAVALTCINNSQQLERVTNQLENVALVIQNLVETHKKTINEVKPEIKGMGPGNMGNSLGSPLGPQGQMGGHIVTQRMGQGPKQDWSTPPQQQVYPPDGYGTSQGMGPGNMGAPLGPPLGPQGQMGCHMVTQSMGTPLQQQRYSLQGYGAPQDLWSIANKGNLPAVKEAIRKGVNVNRQGDSSETPLYAACAGGHHDIVQELIRVGANKETRNIDGGTPLHAACWEGHVAIVEYLLKVGAEKNAKTTLGFTPLHAACYDGHLPVVKKLIDAKVEIEAKDNYGDTPLDIACQEGHIDIQGLLKVAAKQ